MEGSSGGIWTKTRWKVDTPFSIFLISFLERCGTREHGTVILAHCARREYSCHGGVGQGTQKDQEEGRTIVNSRWFANRCSKLCSMGFRNLKLKRAPWCGHARRYFHQVTWITKIGLEPSLDSSRFGVLSFQWCILGLAPNCLCALSMYRVRAVFFLFFVFSSSSNKRRLTPPPRHNPPSKVPVIFNTVQIATARQSLAGMKWRHSSTVL